MHPGELINDLFFTDPYRRRSGKLNIISPSGSLYKEMLSLWPALMKAGVGVEVGCGDGVAEVVAVGRWVVVAVGVGMNAVGVGG
jgi:hypothetical protein